AWRGGGSDVSPSSERPLRIRWRSAVLDSGSGLGWAARLCGAVLAEFVNDKSGMADPCPSAATLAAGMATSERTAQQARRELEQAGLLRLERREGHPARACLTFPTSAPRAGVPLHEVQTTSARTSARTPAPAAPVPENQKNQNTLAPPNS